MTTTLPLYADKFLEYVQTINSENARATYSYALLAFAKSGAKMDLNGIGEFVRWLESEGKGKATIRTYLATISVYVRYCTGYCGLKIEASELARMQNDLRQIRRKMKNKDLPEIPKQKYVDTLLSGVRQEIAEDDKGNKRLEHLRNVAMIYSLYSSGMRVSELVELRREDLDDEEHMAKVSGKGDKQRIVPLDAASWESIKTYLEARDGKRDSVRGLPVFSQHGTNSGNRVLPLTTNRVRQIFSDLREKYGIEFKMTPHSMRRNFATTMLRKTGHLAAVQDMLGHSSPETTRIYARVDKTDMLKVYSKAFDR